MNRRRFDDYGERVTPKPELNLKDGVVVRNEREKAGRALRRSFSAARGAPRVSGLLLCIAMFTAPIVFMASGEPIAFGRVMRRKTEASTKVVESGNSPSIRIAKLRIPKSACLASRFVCHHVDPHTGDTYHDKNRSNATPAEEQGYISVAEAACAQPDE